MEASSNPQSPLFSIPLEYQKAHHSGHVSLQAQESLMTFPTITHDVDFLDEAHTIGGTTIMHHPSAGNSEMNPVDAPLGQELAQHNQQQSWIPTGGEGSHWINGIQDELMEEESLTDLLLTAAEAVEAGNQQLASAAIAILDHLLSDLAPANGTDPFRRLAYYFMQGLRSRSTGSQEFFAPAAGHSATTGNMSAYQMVQELTPYMKFAHFAANQAILEATEGDREVHVVDFYIAEGMQWPPLMVDLSRRRGASLWITAVAIEANVDSLCRTGRRLVEFGESIGFRLRFDQLVVEKEEFDQCGKGQLIANCMISSTMLQMDSMGFRSVDSFMTNFVRKMSPKMVILVDEERFSSSKARPMMSFVEFFCETLHHFSAVSDSLMSSFHGGYKMGVRMVEREMLGPRIVDCVSHHCSFGDEEEEEEEERFKGLWLEGYEAIPPSACNVLQAKFLVGLFNGGYGVLHEEGRLTLCWRSRPLSTVSIWAPN